MAAYKRDVNLFKAAGGGVTKTKKMPLTKKLAIVMVVVLVISVGAIAFLMYLRTQQQATLKKKMDSANAMNTTEVFTRNALKEYDGVQADITELQAIEYMNEKDNTMFTCLSDREIDALMDYFEKGEVYSTDFDFDSVYEGLRKEIVRAQYSVDGYSEYYASTLNNLKYVYSAMQYMNQNKDLFRLLHGQTEKNNLWYCYFRGQFVMLLKGGSSGGVDSTINELTDGMHLEDTVLSKDGNPVYLSPFMSVLEDNSGAKSEFTISCGFAFDVDGETYTVISIARKNVVERIFQIIENCIQNAKEEDAVFDYSYYVTSFSYNSSTQVVTFTINMQQGETFGLEEICTWIDASDFFDAEPGFAYETEDTIGLIEKEVWFKAVRLPFDIMEEDAESLYKKEK